MKTILKIISIIIVFLVLGEKLYSQATSTQGTDFWLSFGRNRVYLSSQVNLQVRVVTSDAATVTFTYTESGTTNTESIAAGSVFTHAFTYEERGRVYSRENYESYKSLHIESDVPVSVYTLNQYDQTTDATNILPVTSLGTDYYHISYKSNEAAYNDGYTVVATEDNTEIYEDGILQSILQKGQVYSAYFGAVDVTGKHITSNNPVAYFVTNGGVWLPIHTGNGADCLYQQLVSVNKWGNNFLVPVTHRGIERVRIVASQDGTVITQTGGVIKTDNGGYGQNSLNLNRGQFVELETNLNSCGCYISSNKPVGVCTYLVGLAYHPPVEKGDPSIAWVPPIEQSINGALIAPFVPQGSASRLDEHFALIVTPTATKDQTTMAIGTHSAIPLTGGQWCDNAISNFSFYSLPLYSTGDAYYFANPHGLTVMGYGIGEFESYYYLSGSASRDLDAAFYVNNVHYQDLDGSIICDTFVNFRASIQYALSTTPGYLKWYIDSVEQVAVRDTLEWSGILSIGVHNVYIEVLDMNNDTITLSSTFGIEMPHYDTISATICFGDEYHDVNFDIVPTQAGFIQYSTTVGCDIFTLNLTVNPVYDSIITDAICQGSAYNKYNFDTIATTNVSGQFTFVRNDTSINGCDSIFILNLTVHPAYDFVITDTICQGSLYNKHNFDTIANTSVSGQFTFVRNDTTINGCDSITTLYLTVHPVYNPVITDTICQGLEYNKHNFDTIANTSVSGQFTFVRNDTTINGCDSITTLFLTVHPTYDNVITDAICQGVAYNKHNFDTIANTSVSGQFTFVRNDTTINGCDSITRLNLTVHPVYDRTIYATICLGESYADDNFNKTPTVAGIITDSVNIPTVIGGCDSIIRLHLTINQTYYDTIIDTICLRETYTQYNFNETPNHAGDFTFIHDETTTKGCDSITTLYLTVNHSYHDTIKAVICLNEDYNDYGFYVAPVQRGIFTYVHDLTTTRNCDSITTLLLTVNPNYDEFIHGIIYEDEFYTVGNYKYNTPGLHISNLQTVEGCDSIVNLYLNVIYYPPEITAFSPLNTDGINDYFMSGFKIQIFNRYGALIYQTKTLEELERGWDGRNIKGQKVEPGVYFYILYNSSGKPRIKSSVEVLKK